ncbi:Inactive glucose-6-phosphate 1-dehydrogenase 4 [Citrus sinensis]|nr:Inactive glucose-6-phosphate 1-dehydrogenase 4 [Citrus sinensis]
MRGSEVPASAGKESQLSSSTIKSTSTSITSKENYGDKMDAFLSRTYYFNGGYDSQEGMLKLSSLMEHIEVGLIKSQIIDVYKYLATLAISAQTQKGRNRIIIEKPFGFDALSSHQLTNALLSKFQEEQLYNAQSYTPNHSIACNGAPINLNGEDIRNKKVKVLRSICRLEPCNVILGHYKDTSGYKVDVKLNNLTPTYFAVALYIGNARWDGVPFVIKASMGLIKHRFTAYNISKNIKLRNEFKRGNYDINMSVSLVTIPRTIQTRILQWIKCAIPEIGNIYHESFGHNIDLATNELILWDVPNEAILVRVNNKVPVLGLQLDASELNLLYKDKYNVEVPDSYEHLLLDVIDGDNHLFMRSDELTAGWNILNPLLQEID